MRIRWNRIAALLLFVALLALTALQWRAVSLRVSSMAALGDRHATPDEHTRAMFTLALLIVGAVGLLRLLIGSSRNH